MIRDHWPHIAAWWETERHCQVQIPGDILAWERLFGSSNSLNKKCDSSNHVESVFQMPMEAPKCQCHVFQCTVHCVQQKPQTKQ